jgi:two-component system cell cycle response regulator DivK
MAKILLVEDNEMNRDMLSRRLSRHGYDIEIAVDGAEALVKAQSVQPDLILMDISLPVHNGFEVTQRLRAQSATAQIPIIALTANATVEDREQAFAAGCNEFETKPVDLPRLLQKIGSFIDSKAA